MSGLHLNNLYRVYRFNIDYTFEQVGVVQKQGFVDLPYTEKVSGRNIQLKINHENADIYPISSNICVSVIVGRIAEENLVIMPFGQFSRVRHSPHLRSFLSILPSELQL